MLAAERFDGVAFERDSPGAIRRGFHAQRMFAAVRDIIDDRYRAGLGENLRYLSRAGRFEIFKEDRLAGADRRIVLIAGRGLCRSRRLGGCRDGGCGQTEQDDSGSKDVR
jgi:hypothetical protein